MLKSNVEFGIILGAFPILLMHRRCPAHNADSSRKTLADNNSVFRNKTRLIIVTVLWEIQVQIPLHPRYVNHLVKIRQKLFFEADPVANDSVMIDYIDE